MALTTALDWNRLNDRSFLTDYTAYKTELVDVGKLLYQALSPHGGSAPTAVDMEGPLAAALENATIFRKICAAKLHAHPMHYPAFAESLARYMLDNDWNDISSP